jgi:hypothetical protein
MPAHPKRLLVIAGCLALAASFAIAQGAKGDKDKDAPPTTATQGATPEVGQITLDHTFKGFLTGDGRSSMKDFRGNVILLDWWGIH